MKAVIFDLDGTLLYSIDTIAYYCNLTLKDLGYKPLDKSDYLKLINFGAHDLISGMLKKIGCDADSGEVLKHYMSLYSISPCHLSRPYEGVCDMLIKLRDRGIKTAVLSNKPDNLVKNISENIFTGMLDISYGQRSQYPEKPDPSSLLALIDELGCKTDNVLYAGDSGVDMQCGKNAGVFTIGVGWGFFGTKPFDKADLIVDKPMEIIEYIDKNSF